jgi:Fe-S-cluster containining protein
MKTDFYYLWTIKLLYLYPFMDCRSNCGACCIALSISSPIQGMPDGKPSGVKCIHLLDDFSCSIYLSVDKPRVCSEFKAEAEFCGADREEAMRILYSLSEE